MLISANFISGGVFALRLATIKHNGKEEVGIITRHGIVLISTLNERGPKQYYATDMFTMICKGHIQRLNEWYLEKGKQSLENRDYPVIKYEDAVYAPLYRTPRKIFGILIFPIKTILVFIRKIFFKPISFVIINIKKILQNFLKKDIIKFKKSKNSKMKEGFLEKM